MKELVAFLLLLAGSGLYISGDNFRPYDWQAITSLVLLIAAGVVIGLHIADHQRQTRN